MEKDIEKKCEKIAKAAGGLLLKWTSPGFTGVPDRILLLSEGKVTFVEFKQPGEDLRPRQRRVKSILEALGFKVVRIDNVESFKKLI